MKFKTLLKILIFITSPLWGIIYAFYLIAIAIWEDISEWVDRKLCI